MNVQGSVTLSYALQTLLEIWLDECISWSVKYFHLGLLTRFVTSALVFAESWAIATLEGEKTLTKEGHS
jgi:hypothetical protein